MRLNFRQGIVRHQTDVSGNPIFLQRSASGDFVDLIASPSPCVLAFAHRDANYIVEELKTVKNAWGPFTTPATRYLYWDISLLTGTLTRGLTLLPPLYGSTAPPTPSIDQNWFDTGDNVFRVWTAQGWSERIRLFAGHITSGAVIHPARIGSQAGLVGACDGGNIVLDSFNKPLRESNGAFVTTVTRFSAINLGTVTSRLESTITHVMALEEIPKNSLVQLRAGHKVVLARSTDYHSRVSGLVVEDLYEGDVGRLITTGLVRSDCWTWDTNKINKPLFCGPAGEVTLTPPNQGALQQIGYVYDVDSILMNVHQVLVLDNPHDVIPPPAPPAQTAPIANFTGTPLIGVAPLAVNFLSTGVYGTTIEWDFTNDSFVDATGTSASYVYAAPGTYTVRQRAINDFGYDDEIKVGYVVVTSPNPGPTFTNLGLKFGAPLQVTAGQVFSFQVIVTNDGRANATNVLRSVKLRSNNGSQITMTSTPLDSVITYTGGKTSISLPLVDIASGNNVVITLQAEVNANVTSIQLEGIVSSPEIDSTAHDNSATITIGVRP